MKYKTTLPELRKTGAVALALAGAALSVSTTLADPPPPHGVVASTIGMQQLGVGNAAADVVVTNFLAVGDFRVRPTANRGDYDVQIGDSAGDDVQGGILITSIAEHSRDQGPSGTLPTESSPATGQLIGTAPNQTLAYDAGPH